MITDNPDRSSERFEAVEALKELDAAIEAGDSNPGSDHANLALEVRPPVLVPEARGRNATEPPH